MQNKALTTSDQDWLRTGAKFGTALLRLLPAEMAHHLGIWCLQKPLVQDFLHQRPLRWLSGMKIDLPGLGCLQHPVGLAAGFDKNAQALEGFAAMGLSFLELGTVTPRPQPGNPKPRMFRQPDQLGLINRMGFNSHGAAQVAKRLMGRQWDQEQTPLGINLGKNKATPAGEALADYLEGLQVFQDLGQYFVINISSPNTQGLRDLAGRDFLQGLSQEAASFLPKLWVKLDPDMDKKSFQQVIEWIADFGYQGVILTNTHKVSWPQMGGQSGHNLSALSQARLEWAHEVHGGKLFMVASGGIFSGLDVFERLRRGAHAVQIYSALVYRGPFAVLEILEELQAEMQAHGVEALSDIIGSFYDS